MEIFVIGNAYKLFEDNHIHITPEIMQQLKISLLSNPFMARMSVLFGFQKFLINASEELINEVNTFVSNISFEKPFKAFVRHELHCPKVLSDI